MPCGNSPEKSDTNLLKKPMFKKFLTILLCFITAVAACVAAGCGGGGGGNSLTVTFTQQGKTVKTVSVKSGKKIALSSVDEPAQEQPECVTEWNFDFSLPVTEDMTVNTTYYTARVSFSSSLKGDYYIITGYNGEYTQVYLPDFYKGKPVTAIKADAFKDKSNIVSVRFPSKLVSIGDNAFKSCWNLQSVEFPDTVTTLGVAAFEDCRNMRSFKFPPKITKVPVRVAQGHKYKSIAVPEGVVAIEAYAFASSIQSIVLPISLERIEYVGIWANLRQIFYAGDSSQWELINISDEPYEGAGGFTFSAKSIAEEIATVYFYSENKPTRPGNYWHYIGEEPTVWN